MAFRSHHPEMVDINLDLISQGISVGLISMTKSRPGAVRDLIDEIRLADPLCGIRFWFLFDDFADLRSWQDLVWLAGSNTDAQADISILNPSSGQQHGTMFVDATIKSLEFDGFERPWPNPVTMDRNTIATVDRKWKDYGLGKLISSPSLGYLKMIRSDSAEIIK